MASTPSSLHASHPFPFRAQFLGPLVRPDPRVQTGPQEIMAAKDSLGGRVFQGALVMRGQLDQQDLRGTEDHLEQMDSLA